MFIFKVSHKNISFLKAQVCFCGSFRAVDMYWASVAGFSGLSLGFSHGLEPCWLTFVWLAFPNCKVDTSPLLCPAQSSLTFPNLTDGKHITIWEMFWVAGVWNRESFTIKYSTQKKLSLFKTKVSDLSQTPGIITSYSQGSGVCQQ